MTAVDPRLRPVADPAGVGEDVAAPGDLVDLGSIERLVRDFYRDVAMDDLLGPIFAAAGVDWPAHIDKLTDFWAWQLLGQPGYQRNPLRAHEPVHQRLPFTGAHFTRWLDLFTAAVDDHATGPVADTAKQRAAKMASALQRLLTGRDGSAHEPVRPYLVARRAPSDAGATEAAAAG
jgi:hemoglobin